jgi:predicted dehydrogenase
MLDAANASCAVHTCNYNYRAYPAVQEARRFIESGDLGEIYMVRGEYLQDWLLLNTDYNWRLDTRQGGRFGAMADVGSHLLDLIEHVTGAQITTMQAICEPRFRNGLSRRPTGRSSTQSPITTARP